MKKLIPLLLTFFTSLSYADLPTGDIILISATEAGVRNLEVVDGRIEKKDEKAFIVFPNLGRAELIPNQKKDEFYAIYPPRMVLHEGKEYEAFSVTIFWLVIEDDGKIYSSFTTPGHPTSEPRKTTFLLKPGKLR